MYPQQRAQRVTRNRIQCLHCDDIIESSGDNGDFVRCSCGKVAIGGSADAPTISGETTDYRDLSQVQNLQVR